MFKDRKHAGHLLAKKLLGYKRENPVVVALPRGGVPVAHEVARALNAPLDIVIVRKLRFPGQPELAAGAIADGKNWVVLWNDDVLRLIKQPHYKEQEVALRRQEISQMTALFRKHRQAIPLTGRSVVIVDDGIATGATVRAAVRRVRNENPLKIIVAAPVASREAVDLLASEADEVTCLSVPDIFGAVGAFYEDFHSVSDDEVIRLLEGGVTA